jgi:hypothetical protein
MADFIGSPVLWERLSAAMSFRRAVLVRAAAQGMGVHVLVG